MIDKVYVVCSLANLYKDVETLHQLTCVFQPNKQVDTLQLHWLLLVALFCVVLLMVFWLVDQYPVRPCQEFPIRFYSKKDHECRENKFSDHIVQIIQTSTRGLVQC